MLRSIGFDNAAVLDGGWDKWLREDRPISSVPTSYPASSLTAQARAGLWAEQAEVRQAINNESVCTLNALQPEVFTGEIAPYGRAGHIPGSYNVYSNSLLDSDTGVFLPLDQLKERFEASAVMQNPRAILYCGGGVSATVGALALTLLGHPDIAVYDGSMTDWVQDPSLPLVCGETP
jgi:thiosulfate/3-mercaptopyruvate sulfurtransferase